MLCFMQPELNGGDIIFQHTSTTPGVRRPNSTGKSKSSSSTLIPSQDSNCSRAAGVANLKTQLF